MSSWVVTVALSPGGSAWATLAVALDDPRVSTWRLGVWVVFFWGGKIISTGLQLQVWRSLLNNDTGGEGKIRILGMVGGNLVIYHSAKG